MVFPCIASQLHSTFAYFFEPPWSVAVNARVNTQKRSINADDFFVRLYETSLDDDEIILSVDFEPPELSGYIKFPNPASLYAMVGVFVSKFSSGTVRLAITGAGIDGVFRHLAMEKKLESNFSQSAVRHVSICADELLSDQHCDREYRAHLISVIASRAVEVAAKSKFAWIKIQSLKGLSFFRLELLFYIFQQHCVFIALA